MGRLQTKGKKGAAKNYITRNQALKRLQCSLSDFRRLCILKGIFPREPRNKKKANNGSSAPASFYYTKDILYLQHEPILAKLREHKAFAKKISRALGRGEWAEAKSLEENNKPSYRLDHVIKERYPTFTHTLNDLPDALSLVTLFSHLPSNAKVPPSIIENCARLSAEWQLYVMRTRCLRRVFLSIKGVYFEAEIEGRPVRWLVPYMFTQHIPEDVDFRILLTFLELHQTLLGFVLFKLYTDINLVYPPPLDVEKDASGAGVGAFNLREATGALTRDAEADVKKKVSARDVRKEIKNIGVSAPAADEEMADADAAPAAPEDADLPAADEFVEQPSKSAPSDPSTATLTLSSLIASSASTSALQSLFAPYTFFLSREVTRPTLEFVIRSFGGKVGWDTTTLGGGSPVADEADPSITHMIVDRPQLPERLRKLPKRAYIQPQWVVDCINAGKILPTEQYAPGVVLPPHLSPFQEAAGYVPGAEEEEESEEEDEEMEAEEGAEVEEEAEEDASPAPTPKYPTAALLAAAASPENASLRDAAELEAEQLGVPHATFEAELKKATKAASKKAGKGKASTAGADDEEKGMAQLMMSNKQRKLYEKMQYSNRKKAEEAELLKTKKAALAKKGKKGGKA